MEEPTYCNSNLHHWSSSGPTPLAVKIRNARESNRTFSVWNNGFECVNIPSRVNNWNDAQDIEKNHYAEIKDWATAFTGCDEVLFFPAIIRNPAAAQKSSDYAPIEFAHSDYTEQYGDMIRDREHPYHSVLQPSMSRAGLSADRLFEAQRVLTLQLWRSTGPRLMDHPLALCDATTVPRSQLSTFRVESYGGVETQFDSLVMSLPSADQENHWYCYPEMEEDEVLLFRAFDSDCVATGSPFWTPHTAFRDPHSSNVPRSSVEMRAICIFF